MTSENVNNFKDITNPEYVGPGSWNIIHRLSFKAQSKEKQLYFIEFMKELCQGFPCNVCRGHCIEYIKNHPMEEYLGVTIEINNQPVHLGMFIWAWKFHNSVNKRLNKPIMSWDTAYNFYSQSDLVCSSHCMNSNQPPDNTSNNVSINLSINLSNNILNRSNIKSNQSSRIPNIPDPISRPFAYTK